MTIWDECSGAKHIIGFKKEPWRVVEAQHISSSRDLVDDVEEHDLLESLLEQTKPAIDNRYNYLIFTPFRYPPLKYGSRFGKDHEPSLWYGSLELSTAFAEVAYYRLKFFDDTEANLGYIELPLTAFSVIINTSKGIDLTAPPFSHFNQDISNKTSYQQSQILGADMRRNEVEAFIFYSARTLTLKKNIAAFTPKIFFKTMDRYITNHQNWRSLTSKDSVEFTRDSINGVEKAFFNKSDFNES